MRSTLLLVHELEAEEGADQEERVRAKARPDIAPHRGRGVDPQRVQRLLHRAQRGPRALVALEEMQHNGGEGILQEGEVLEHADVGVDRRVGHHRSREKNRQRGDGGAGNECDLKVRARQSAEEDQGLFVLLE